MIPKMHPKWRDGSAVLLGQYGLFLVDTGGDDQWVVDRVAMIHQDELSLDWWALEVAPAAAVASIPLLEDEDATTIVLDVTATSSTHSWACTARCGDLDFANSGPDPVTAILGAVTGLAVRLFGGRWRAQTAALTNVPVT